MDGIQIASATSQNTAYKGTITEVRVGLTWDTLTGTHNMDFDDIAIFDGYTVTDNLRVSGLAVTNTYGPKSINMQAIPGMSSGDDLLLYITNASLVTDNDVYIKGSITSTSDFLGGKKSGGGALLISHGWLGSKDQQGNIIALSPPMIKLMTTDHTEQNEIQSGPTLPTQGMTNQPGQIFYQTPLIGPPILQIWDGQNWQPHTTHSSGYYDTLFLLKNNGYEPANLDVGDLTIHGLLDMSPVGADLCLWNMILNGDGTSGSSSLLNASSSMSSLAETDDSGGAAEYPQLLIDAPNATIRLSTDCNLYRAVKEGSTVVLETDNGFVCPDLNCNGISVNQNAGITGALSVGNGLTVTGNAKIAGYTQFNNDVRLAWVNNDTLEVQNDAGAAYSGNLNLNNIYVAGNIQPIGAQGYIGFNTKLRVNGDFQISGGHVVSSLNPSGSVALGSGTEPWTGVATTTVYTDAFKHLNGTDWSLVISGSTPTFNGLSMAGNIIPTVAGSPSAGYYCGSSAYPWKIVNTYYLYANTSTRSQAAQSI